MNATILCYHKVGPGTEEGRRLNIEPERLRSHVEFFSRRRRPIVRACDLADRWQPGTVCFTFDDAYLSTMRYAPKIFEELGVRASFYAVPGKVGGTSDWDGDLARPLAGWDLLSAAHASGHEIGNHSLTHLQMAGLKAVDQTNEVMDAHKAFLAKGIAPKSFCFPYGSLNESAVQVLADCGYPIGLALGKAIARDTDDKRKLTRIVVAYSDTLPMLIYKISIKPLLKRRR
jgi:peptidoglycan/xylan/chitin deacetylase (PgdA/CDA1 family)